jgi:hypothetical protein
VILLNEHSPEWSLYKLKGELFDAKQRMATAIFILSQAQQHLDKAESALTEAVATYGKNH